MDYHNLLNKLYSINQQGSKKIDLSNTERLSRALKQPEKQFASVHIAGSNGKGSVATKIAKGLELSGLKVGLYTSPHISSFRERISINGEMISEESLRGLLNEIFHIITLNSIPATFFEITTLIAFCHFAKSQVDIAVLETGLGGRLDSTNIVTPKLSVITSISLEHTDILGKTFEEITKEKAGIIKSSTPVVIGPSVPLEVIAPIAKKLNAPCFQVTNDHIEKPCSNFDNENSAIAKKGLELLGINDVVIQEALKTLPSCRIEKITPKIERDFPQPDTVILDVAHNPAGLDRLFSYLNQYAPKRSLRIVCGLSKNKDILPCLAILKQHGHCFHLVEAANGRGVSAKELSENLLLLGVPREKLFVAPTLKSNLLQALQEAGKKKDLLVVCGTFFIMGTVRKLLGIDEPQDFIELNEISLPQIEKKSI